MRKFSRKEYRIADRVIINRDINYPLGFLVGFQVRHVLWGLGTIVGVSKDHELCTFGMPSHCRSMTFVVDELVDPNGDWEVDIKQLERVFDNHKAEVVRLRTKRDRLMIKKLKMKKRIATLDADLTILSKAPSLIDDGS